MRRVVFDLGGVLVKVAKNWGEAAAAAGLDGISAEIAELPLVEFPGLELFQAGKLTQEDYCDQLSRWLLLEWPDPDQALNVHQGILMGMYPGTLDIIEELHRVDLATGCLSNTNAPHWEHMAGSGLFPNVSALQVPGLSHELGMEKPVPAIYRAYEELCQTPGHDIIFFDDGFANVENAKRSGWRAHLIDPSGDTAEQLRSHLSEFGI